MRVVFHKKNIIGLLLALNIAALSLITFLQFEIKKNQVVNLTQDTLPLVLPELSEGIKKIEVSSKAYIIYDPQSRTIISGKNERLRFSPASSTKIMTATVALEEYGLGDTIKATGLDKVEGSTMRLHEGEIMTVENLLYGLLLPSGNDAAHVIASYYRSGEAGFVARMNEKSRELNLTNTRFVDPAGFLDDNYTTAFDLARLTSYALENPKFASIVSTKNKTVTDISGKTIHELSNLNELLGVDGVIGVKTGFSEEAQGVLVSSIEHDGRIYIVVVLGSRDRFFDTRNIIEQALENITLISY